MVVAPHALVEAQSAIVVAGQYAPLVLPKLTAATTTVDLAGNEKPLGHNAWLEDRYRDRVPEILLDVVGESDGPWRSARRPRSSSPARSSERHLPKLPQAARRDRLGLGSTPRAAIASEGPQTRATSERRKDVESTRAWYARVNLIKGVQRLATAEYAAKAATILSWYRKRIERNMAFLWRAVAEGEARRADDRSGRADEEHGFPSRGRAALERGQHPPARRQAPKDWHAAFDGRQPRLRAFGELELPRSELSTCARSIRRTRANVFTDDRVPTIPRALALLMGIPEKKMPWPLQHWTTREPYTGNSILDRVDPQDSRLDDPWRHLDLQLSISISKRAYNQLRKDHDLPPKEIEVEK